MAKKNKKQALGRGLSALLDDPQNEIKSINDINADKVVGNIIDLDLKKSKSTLFNPEQILVKKQFINWLNPFSHLV